MGSEKAVKIRPPFGKAAHCAIEHEAKVGDA
jgi:hypothetical protein